MRYVWLQRDGHRRVLIFFAGWAMDHGPFERLVSDAHDVCVCFDYRQLPRPVASSECLGPQKIALVDDPLRATLADYQERVVVAWSFGCAVAAHLLAEPPWPVQRAVAINGTVVPEHAELGIPQRWLDATAAHLSPRSWDKFLRRMGMDQEDDPAFRLPERDLKRAADELEALRELAPPAHCRFTSAVVGRRDRIIPPENQRRCWDHHGVPTRLIEAPHYPFHLWKTWEEVLASGAVDR